MSRWSVLGSGVAGLCVATRLVEREMLLSREDAVAVALMGPSAHHVSPDEAWTRAGALPEPASVALSVNVSTWRSAPVG